MHPGQPMTRAEIFAELRRIGVTHARVPYNGGNDESFVEAPEVTFADDSSEAPDRLSEQLEAALEESVYEQIGDSFGDSTAGVDGALVYDVEKEKVSLVHSYMDWVSEEPQEV